VNVTGGFVAQFPVASNTPPGVYPVAATDTSGLNAENILFVVSSPKIVLGTAGKAHVVGVILSVNGSGFSIDKSVTVYFDNQFVGSTIASDTGSFLYSFSVLSIPAGTYYVNATDGSNSALKTFVLNPHLKISPNTGTTVGEKITVAGTGFSANVQVRFTFGGSKIPTRVTTKSDGSFSVQITIPNIPKGGYEVVGTDADGRSAQGRVGVSN